MSVTIHQVRDLLAKTIADKEAYHAKLIDNEPTVVNAVMCQMLRINIDELKVILFDVEQCCKKATEDSWIINPERMGH